MHSGRKTRGPSTQSSVKVSNLDMFHTIPHRQPHRFILRRPSQRHRLVDKDILRVSRPLPLFRVLRGERPDPYQRPGFAFPGALYHGVV